MFRPDIYGRDGLRDLVAGHERDPERRAGAALDAGALIRGVGPPGRTPFHDTSLELVSDRRF